MSRFNKSCFHARHRFKFLVVGSRAEIIRHLCGILLGVQRFDRLFAFRPFLLVDILRVRFLDVPRIAKASHSVRSEAADVR